jgi:hypothetical protein
VIVLALFSVEFAFLEFPKARAPFWFSISSLTAWVLITLLRSDVAVKGDQLHYRSWLGLRSIALDSARGGILVRRGKRLTILVPLGATALSRPLALRSAAEWSELLQTTRLQCSWIE